MSAPVTVVTGTRKGIGRYLAEHYLERGHAVIGCSRGAAEWERPGYFHFQLDVSNETAVQGLFSDVRRTFGKLDHLINNAGIAAMNHSLLTPGSTVHKVLGTNVVGTFLCCREAAKIMKSSHYGRIVNFTTVAVELKLEGEAAYVASKAAVLSLTEVLARELGEFGITVNAVGPTPIDTDLTRNVPKEKIDRLVERQAIRRLGTFSDVANVVDFFLLKESGFVTGQNLYLGGV
jgi:3-oxoacyl-[acyl-carrier protein] reductase